MYFTNIINIKQINDNLSLSLSLSLSHEKQMMLFILKCLQSCCVVAS